MKINIEINNTVLKASLEDNASSGDLTKLLQEGPVKINMEDYAGMEKVGSLPKSIVRTDRPTQAKPLDIILYLGNQFVIYYKPNAWDFTKLGRIENMDVNELRALLGKGSVQAILSLDEA